MPKYRYKASDKSGQIYQNIIEANSRVECIQMLKRNKLLPIEITIDRKDRKSGFLKPAETIVTADGVVTESVSFGQREVNLDALNKVLNPVKHRDIVIFLQSFLLLKKANFNNIDAINTIRKSTENRQLQITLIEIQTGLEQGYYMYEMLEKYPKEFPYIVVNMIKVGELSGSLVESIEQAIEYIEKEHETRTKVRKAVVPNVLTFLAVLIMLIAGTLIAIPQIQEVFDQVGGQKELPKITVAFSKFLDWVIKYWYIPTAIIGALVAVLVSFIKTPVGKFKWDGFKYKAPVFGKLIYSLDFSKLVRSLLLNLRSGLRIQDSLEISRNLVKNQVMVSMIEQSLNNIYNGESWIEPFEKSGFGTPMATDMLYIGMETDLTEMMEKLLEIMDQDVELKIERVMKVLPQISYSFVGAILIFLVLVVLVPAIEMYMGDFLFDAYL